MQNTQLTIGTLSDLQKADIESLPVLTLSARAEKIQWVKTVLNQFAYFTLSREDKGLVRAYIQHMTGCSRAQTARYIADTQLAAHEVSAAPAQKIKSSHIASAVLTLALLLLISRSTSPMFASVSHTESSASSVANNPVYVAALPPASSKGSQRLYGSASSVRPADRTAAEQLFVLQTFVADRKASRLARLITHNAASAQSSSVLMARPDRGIETKVFPPYPPLSGTHPAASVSLSLKDVLAMLGSGTDGQILQMQGGRPAWVDFPYLQQIRSLAPQGDEPTRRGGGMRNGGSPQSTTNTTIVNNITTGGTSAPSGWTEGVGVVYLTDATDFVGIGTDTPDTNLEVVGSISGASLYIASSIEGAGLTACDPVNGKIVWDSVTKQFSCGTDNAVGTGLSIQTADQRYVKKQGDTMTGALVINIQNGNLASVGLNVINTISGAIIHAEKSLTTSGTLVFEGAASGSSLYLGKSLNGAGLVDCSTSGTSKLLWNAASGRFSCGTDTDTNTTYTAGQGLGMNGTIITLNANLSGSLLRFTTVSGSTVFANTSLRSSGSLTVAGNTILRGTISGSTLHLEKTLSVSGSIVTEGTISGANLFVGTSITGAGLTTCSNATTSKLLWNAATGRFVCGTDTDTNTPAWSSTGALQIQFDNRYVRTSGGTMTGSLTVARSISGATIHAEKSLTTSGTLVFEGAASGSSLYLGASLNGAGLVDCSTAGTSKLLWNATTGRFGCGTDQNTGTAYTAGQGIGVNSNVITLNASISGSLIRFTTISGSTIYGKNSINSSGSITAEGTISGANLFVGTSITGAGLTACNSATSALQWNAVTGRFSCGTIAVGSSTSSGNVITIGDSRYVRKSGDTMTGALTIAVTNGNRNTVGINVVNTISGAVIHAEKSLTTSGTLVFEGAASGSSLYIASSLQGAGLVDCSTAGTSKLLWNSVSGRFSCGTDTDTNTTYTAGQGLSMNGTVITLNANISGSLIRFTTISGSTVFAKNTLATSGSLIVSGTANIRGAFSGSNIHAEKGITSSGSITTEGTISGANLFVGTGITGAGLTTCSNATTSKLLWNSATGRFSCGTDQNTTAWSSTGALQIQFDNRYVRTSGGTMTGTLNVTRTVSGAVIHAEKSLTTSGTLVFEGAASGSSLYIASSLQGAGLVDCSTSGTSKLLWNAASGRFSCGTDQNSGTTYTAGQGLSLNGTVITLNANISGSLIRFTTISGSTVYAKNSLRSSGSLIVSGTANIRGSFSGSNIHAEKGLTASGNITTEGTISGASLYIGTSINGAGLSDCVGGNKLLWNSATGRFSCGIDQAAGSGLDQNSADSRYVNTSGDTMTGALTIHVQGGALVSVGLNVLNTLSGAVIHAEKNLTSSGNLAVAGMGTFGNSLGNNGIQISQNQIKFLYPAASTIDIIDDLQFRTTTLAPLLAIKNNGNIGINTTAPKGKFVVVGSGAFTAGLSGSTLHAEQSLTSSGSITAEGAISGASLYIGSSIRGAGLTNCNTASSALQWNSATGRFSCGTIAAGSSTSSGNVITIGDSRYVRKSGDTMTGALTVAVTNGNRNTVGINVVNTISGAVIHAEKSLTTSGTLVFEGAASGSSLYIASSLQGAGLVDCSTAGTSKLLWNAASGRFSCGSDQNTTYTAGQGLSLNGTVITLNANISGSLIRFTTVSGSTVFAKNTLATSGSLIVSGTANIRGAFSGSNIHAEKGITASGSITTEGTISGANLFVGTGITGAGLTTCSNATTSKLLWNSATGRFSCGTDFGTNFGSGQVIAIGDTRYVRKSGDTMTGALTINMQGGTLGTIGLNVLNTMSGAIIHAEKSITSSGAILAAGNISTKGTLSGAALTVMNGTSYIMGSLGIGNATPGSILDIGTRSGHQEIDISLGASASDEGRFVFKENTTARMSFGYVGGTREIRFTGGANLSSNIIMSIPQNGGIVVSAPLAAVRAAFEVKGTISGASILASQSLRSSGSLVVAGNATIRGSFSGNNIHAEKGLTASGNITTEGTISGANLFVGTGITGAGLTTCSNATTSKLLWNSATGRFSCGTDFGTNFGSGQVIAIGDTRYIRTSGGTMTGALTVAVTNGNRNTLGINVANTISGAVIHAEKSLTTSGTLVFEGAASGSSLYLGTSLNGAGLVDCSTAGTSKLLWNAASGRFSCGSDQNTTYTAGQGLSLNGTVITLNANISGSLIRFTTISGSTVFAKNTLRSSGSLIVDGATTVRGSFSGSNIHAEKGITSSGSITTEGTISGANLFVGTGITGAGLTTCSNGSTSKLLWDSTTGRFSCGTDQTGGAGFGSGQVIVIGDTRFVRKSGDTMTGSLIIRSTSGSLGIGLNVVGTMSGVGLHISGTGSYPLMRTFPRTGTVIIGSGSIRGGSGYMLPQLYVPGGRTPVLVGNVSTTAAVDHMAVQGNTIVATAGTILRSFDISTPTNPKFLSTAAVTSSNPASIVIQGKYAFIGVQIRIQSFDISNPAAIVPLNVFTPTSAVNALAVQGRYLYSLNTTSARFQVVDISNPSNMVGMGTAVTGTTPNAIAVQGRYAYITNGGSNTLQVIDLKNATAPVSLGTVSAGTTPNGVAVQGRFAYVINSAGLQIFDVSNPSSVASVSTLASGAASDIKVSGRYAYIVGANGFQTIDISDPRTPYMVSTVSTGLTTLNQISLQGRYAYVSYTGGTRLYVYDLGGADIQNAEIGVLDAGAVNIRELLQGMDASFQGSVSAGASLIVAGHASFGTGGMVTIGTGGLVVRGPGFSGSSVYAATSIQGAGLADCSTASTSKLLWTAATGRFSCGTDTAGSFSTGNVLTIGNARYVELKGDSMTGSLQTPSINLSGVLLTSLNGFNQALNLNTAGLATNGITRLSAGGDLTNIGTIQSGEIHARMGGTFAAKADYTTGTSPYGVAIGDLNGDGRADMAVTNQSSTTVSVFLNNGAGTFAGKVDYTTGTSPRSVAIGDINGDGRADLAIANYGSTSMSILMNTGNGTFATKVDYTTGTAPQSIAMGDLNRDGKADIAVANSTNTSVSVFLNNGNGTFATKVDYTTGSFPYSVTMGDVNGDGKLDMAVANWNSTSVSIFMNNGNGTFAAKADYTTGANPIYAAIGDLNGDGKADMAVANSGADSASVFINNGAGTFAAKVDYATGSTPYSVAIGDLNGDGRMDLAVTNSAATSVSVFANNGNGTFATKVDYTTGSNPQTVTLGDVNGDGRLDMAVTNPGSTNVSIFLNNSRTIFTASAGTGGVVGIGTATPGSKLSVSGSTLIGNNIGNRVAKTQLEVIGTISGSTIYAANTLRSSGSIVAEGIISGASLYVGTGIQGAGLTDCSSAGSSKLLWTASTGRFSCGTDQNTNWSGTGALQNQFDNRYVRTSGGTMTGTLNVTRSISGAVIHAEKTLSSSGSIVAEGTISGANLYVGTSIRGAGLVTDCNTAGSSALQWTASTGRFSCGSISGGGTFSTGNVLTIGSAKYVSKQGDTMTGALVINSTTTPTNRSGALVVRNTVSGASGALVSAVDAAVLLLNSNLESRQAPHILFGYKANFDTALWRSSANVLSTNGTFSGTTVYAAKSLRSSGSIVAEGAISGASLYIGTSLRGAGLVTDCNASTSALQWTASTGRFSCGTISAGSAFSTGNVLTIGSAKYVSRFGDTITGTLKLPAVLFSSGSTLTGGSGFNEFVNLIRGGLATKSITRLTADGNLTNIGSIQSGEINATMGGIFALNKTYPVSSLPRAIDSADYNGDGKPDLALALTNVDQVAVLLNSGTGGFLTAVNYGVADGPQAIASADYNGDGIPDLAVANYSDNNVSILINKGNGTFLTAVNYGVGANPNEMEAGDLNNDGLMDLAVVNNQAPSMSILLNRGSGRFATAVDYTTGSYPTGIAIGDLNGDSKQDIAVSSYNTNKANIFINAGNGTFASKVDYTVSANSLGAYDVDIGDTNGDKKPDLALVESLGNFVSILRNNGNGTFGTYTTYPTVPGDQPYKVRLADLNGDGKKDVIMNHYLGYNISTYLNTGTGTFPARVDYNVGINPIGLAVQDFNGDGKVDFATGISNDSTAAVYFNTPRTILYASTGTGGFVSIGTAVTKAKLTVMGTISRGTGAYITSSGGTVLALEASTQSGARTPNIAFGYRGNFDTRITRTSTGSLRFASNTGTLLTLDTERSDATGNVFQIISDASTSYGGPDENRVFRIQANGAVFTDGAVTSIGADYAEWFYSGNEKLTPGEVVCIDITKNNSVKRCINAGDANIMGIVSTNPAFIGNGISGADGLIPPGYALIGLIGQVPAHVIVEGTGAIRPGDALTSAKKPGYARKALPGESTVGVALEGISSGEGVVNVLISRRNSSMTVDAVGQKVLDTIASMKIGDEVQLMVASSLQNLNVDDQIQTEVRNQVSNLKSYDADIHSLQAEIDDLKNQLAVIKSQTGSTTIITTTTGSALTADLTAATLVLEQTLATGGDARIGGDLHIDGSLMASSLFVPNGLTIDGGTTITGAMTSSTIHTTSGATIDGTLTVNGNIRVHSGALLFDSGSTVQMSDLIVENSLRIVGSITIDGLARFFGNVEVYGELRVSGRQAGVVTVPAGSKSVSVQFSTGFSAVPIITATPNDFVFSAWRVKPVTQTGFTIEFATVQDTDVTFSWHALIGLDQGSTGIVQENTSTVFPMGSDNIPVSSDMFWNACIRNTTLLDADGKPHSCARYHEDFTWHQPDLGIDFLWNTNMTPPLLIVPNGYTIEVTDSEESIRNAFSIGDNEEAPQSSSEASSEESSEQMSSAASVEQTSSAMSSEASSVASMESSVASEPSIDELTINPVTPEAEAPAATEPAPESAPEPTPAE